MITVMYDYPLFLLAGVQEQVKGEIIEGFYGELPMSVLYNDIIMTTRSLPEAMEKWSGDGKLRTMEISLAIKNWALEVAPIMRSYEHRFSHVEPTGAGVARIDFTASSALCKWYFPLIMYTLFAQSVNDPTSEFAV